MIFITLIIQSDTLKVSNAILVNLVCMFDVKARVLHKVKQYSLTEYQSCI